jgi:hypothetical protein
MVRRLGSEDVRGDPRDGHLLACDRFGQLVHAAIGDLMARNGTGGADVVAAVTRTLERNDSANPALRRRLTAAVSNYAKQFAPRGATLIGVELTVGEQRLDLVWRTAHVIWADELKSGGDRLTFATARQCARQVRAARAHWSAAFVGVRIVWLQTPGRELWVGSREASR